MSTLTRFIHKFVPDDIWQEWHMKNSLKDCVCYPLIKHPEDVFESLYHIKDKTWEKMYAPAVFGRAKERVIECAHPAQDIWLVKNGIVSQDSDVVLSEYGAWWDKYNDEDFITRVKPHDINVVGYDTKNLYVRHRNNVVHIDGRTLSLVGVFTQVWSHFMFQFLCKLYYAGEAGLLDSDITILTYDYKDSNIEELLETYIAKFPHAKRLRAVVDTEYYCDELICMPSLSTNNNETKFGLDYGFCSPRNVIDMLQKYVVKPYVDRVKDRPVKYPKIFIGRSTYRVLSNKDEVEQYFREQGFYFIEGANLSLEEKADLFYHAEEIVGMHCSAWQNLIFCDHAKCLEMSNYRYSTETVFRTLAYDGTPYWINLSGQDEDTGLMGNYFISIDKVKAAYESFKNGEYK